MTRTDMAFAAAAAAVVMILLAVGIAFDMWPRAWGPR